MKLSPPTLLALATLALAPALNAENVVVFGERRFFNAGGKPPVTEGPDQQAFYLRSGADLAHPGSWEKTLPLINPPAWGKTVSAATHGQLSFHPSFVGGFDCQVELSGLVPGHTYILTLNGNPKLAGNGLLPNPVPGLPAERYYDFLIVRTDDDGHYAANLGIFLQAGRYDVRWYVKDAADFKIVLYQDYFPFEVK
jgi:hypothetical protein